MSQGKWSGEYVKGRGFLENGGGQQYMECHSWISREVRDLSDLQLERVLNAAPNAEVGWWHGGGDSKALGPVRRTELRAGSVVGRREPKDP